jgi:glutamate 5-kinase
VRSAPYQHAKRIVLKFGTGILTDSRKRPDQVQLAQLVAQVANLRAEGRDVVLVSSGAVGAGRPWLSTAAPRAGGSPGLRGGGSAPFDGHV